MDLYGPRYVPKSRCRCRSTGAGDEAWEEGDDEADEGDEYGEDDDELDEGEASASGVVVAGDHDGIHGNDDFVLDVYWFVVSDAWAAVLTRGWAVHEIAK